MHWVELFVKWSPVIGPWVNVALIPVIGHYFRRCIKHLSGMADSNHRFAIDLADQVIVLAAEVARLKALAGIIED